MGFYERYAECCKERGIQPASQWAAEQIGCSRSNISSFAKKNTVPKGEIVARAAKMLDVSADYLLGLIDVPRKLDGTDPSQERMMKKLIGKLNSDGKDAAIAMLSGLSDQNRYSIEGELKTQKNEED